VKRGQGISRWLQDTGSGTTIKWYNRISHAGRELDKVRVIQVGKKASARIHNAVKEWLKKRRE
ncbi:MAG: hypothetical protein GY757_26980, partial [bacterium]|nr:hypothetical protein [bacterium]